MNRVSLSDHSNDLWSDENFTDREALLTTAEQIAQTGSWVWDYANRRVEWSDGMFRILGLSPETQEPSIEAFDRAIHPDDWCPFVAARQKIISTGQGEIVEVRIVRPGGEVRNIVLNIVVFNSENGKHVRSVGTALDVTERRALEAQLHEANKLQLVGQIAGGVAHDFNNILTGIIGYCEILQIRHQQRGLTDLAEMTDYIFKAAENAAAVTSRLMTFVRKQPLSRVPCDAHSVIAEAKGILDTSVAPEIRIEIDAAASRSHVLADVSQLQSALLNLGLNARDAIEDGGHITFSTAVISLDDKAAESLACPCAPGQYLRISVADDGRGMPEATRTRLFEPFFTTKKNGTGTGLGLISVREAMQAHHGGISVESTPDQGSVISLYVPLISEEEDTDSQPTEFTGTGRILVIDDDQAVRRLLQASLSMAGYQIHAEAGGREGLLKFMSDAKGFDAVVLDVIMPELTGWDILKRIREVNARVPVLVVTGFTDSISTEQVIEQGGTALLRKPFRTRALLGAVSHLLEQRKQLDDDAIN